MHTSLYINKGNQNTSSCNVWICLAIQHVAGNQTMFIPIEVPIKSDAPYMLRNLFHQNLH